MTETEELKVLRHEASWNAAINIAFIAEKDNIIENISNARPIQSLDVHEYRSMFPYSDCPTRWDVEMGWYGPNNDQVSEDVCGNIMFEFSKDVGKIALQRYYIDWVGRTQMMCTVGKLSQFEKED